MPSWTPVRPSSVTSMHLPPPWLTMTLVASAFGAGALWVVACLGASDVVVPLPAASVPDAVEPDSPPEVAGLGVLVGSGVSSDGGGTATRSGRVPGPAGRGTGAGSGDVGFGCSPSVGTEDGLVRRLALGSGVDEASASFWLVGVADPMGPVNAPTPIARPPASTSTRMAGRRRPRMVGGLSPGRRTTEVRARARLPYFVPPRGVFGIWSTVISLSICLSWYGHRAQAASIRWRHWLWEVCGNVGREHERQVLGS